MRVEVTAVKHTDVRGKDMLYLKISNGKTDYVVNVGQKTYDTVKEMEQDVHKTTLTQEEIKNKINESKVG